MPKGPGTSFDFELRAHPRAKRRVEEAPLRILVLGDFAGRGSREGARLGDLAARRPLRVDLDAVFASLAPELELGLEAEAGLIPVLSMKSRAAAAVMRLQSIGDPSQGLAGPWSP